MIDIAQLKYNRIINIVNRNLLKMTNRNLLTEMIFEQIALIKNMHQEDQESTSRELNISGLGGVYHQVFKECKA